MILYKLPICSPPTVGLTSHHGQMTEPVRKPHFRFGQKVRSRSDIGILGENTDLLDLSFDVASYNLAKLYLCKLGLT